MCVCVCELMNLRTCLRGKLIIIIFNFFLRAIFLVLEVFLFSLKQSSKLHELDVNHFYVCTHDRQTKAVFPLVYAQCIPSDPSWLVLRFFTFMSPVFDLITLFRTQCKCDVENIVYLVGK